MPTFHTFEEIDAWKESRELVREVYALTRRAPFRSDHGLRDQIRRSAVSVMSNIAEGSERDGNAEFFQFLSTAKGSAGEVRSHLYVALDAGHLSQEDTERLLKQCRRISGMVAGLMRYLRKAGLKGRKFRADGSF